MNRPSWGTQGRKGSDNGALCDENEKDFREKEEKRYDLKTKSRLGGAQNGEKWQKTQPKQRNILPARGQFLFGIRTRKNGADQAIMTHRRIREVGVWGLRVRVKIGILTHPLGKKTETGGPYLLNSQKATAAAAATLSESTPWCMGMRTV